MKKFFKFIQRVLAVSFLLLLIAFTTLIFFQKKIKQTCLDNLNLVLNTDVKLEDADLSVMERFPHVSLHLKGLQVKDAISGSRDSLIVLEDAYLGLDFKKLLIGQYVINYCELSHGYIQIKVDEQGQNNFTLWAYRN